MYMAIAENEDGTWWDAEPIPGDTQAEVIRLARDLWRDLTNEYEIVIYRCSVHEVLWRDRPTPAERAAVIADAGADPR